MSMQVVPNEDARQLAEKIITGEYTAVVIGLMTTSNRDGVVEDDLEYFYDGGVITCRGIIELIRDISTRDKEE